MSFVFPQFLFALFAVAIPIIIHLFSFRRYKKIYFSDIRFLKEVTQEAKSRNKLKHLLVLLTRILAVSFLVLAFAQPYIPTNKKKAVIGGINAVSIYVDNSFSMENVGINGALFDQSKKIAREVALAYSPSDFFQLLTNDFEGKHQRLVNREEFLFMLDDIKISPSVKTLSEVSSRQQDLLSHSEIKNKRCFIVSDFQKSISNIESFANDTSIATSLVPVSANRQNNLFIDSCWFESPVHQLNMAEKLFVRIKNNSEEKFENAAIKLYINNQLKTPASFSIEAGETKEIALSFTNKESGIQQGKIEITDYPVTYDDKFYLSYDVAKNINILSINHTTDATIPVLTNPIQSLFGKDSLFILSTQDESKMDYSSLPFQQLIILNELTSISSGLAQELNRFTANGGSLLLFPSYEKLDTASYKAFLSSLGAKFYLQQDTINTKVDWVNFDSDIFSDVFERSTLKDSKEKNTNLDLPLVNSHYLLGGANKSQEEILLRLKNKRSFLSKYIYKKGKVYVSAVPLNNDWSNLSKHAMYVPLMYKIAMNSQPSTELFYTIGKDKPITVKEKTKGEEVFKIKADTGSVSGFEIIPESRIVEQQPTIFIHDQIQQAGNYQLFSGQKSISGLAFNYDRKESDLSFYTQDELLSHIEKAALQNVSLLNSDNQNMTKVLADISSGKKLWKWCIIVVLLLLAIETLLLRISKK